jgi:hypothetical protein
MADLYKCDCGHVGSIESMKYTHHKSGRKYKNVYDDHFGECQGGKCNVCYLQICEANKEKWDILKRNQKLKREFDKIKKYKEDRKKEKDKKNE